MLKLLFDMLIFITILSAVLFVSFNIVESPDLSLWMLLAWIHPHLLLIMNSIFVCLFDCLCLCTFLKIFMNHFASDLSLICSKELGSFWKPLWKSFSFTNLVNLNVLIWEMFISPIFLMLAIIRKVRNQHMSWFHFSFF